MGLILFLSLGCFSRKVTFGGKSAPETPIIRDFLEKLSSQEQLILDLRTKGILCNNTLYPVDLLEYLTSNGVTKIADSRRENVTEIIKREARTLGYRLPTVAEVRLTANRRFLMAELDELKTQLQSDKQFEDYVLYPAEYAKQVLDSHPELIGTTSLQLSVTIANLGRARGFKIATSVDAQGTPGYRAAAAVRGKRTMTKLWGDEGYRKMMCETMRTPEYRRKSSESALRRWSMGVYDKRNSRSATRSQESTSQLKHRQRLERWTNSECRVVILLPAFSLFINTFEQNSASLPCLLDSLYKKNKHEGYLDALLNVIETLNSDPSYRRQINPLIAYILKQLGFSNLRDREAFTTAYFIMLCTLQSCLDSYKESDPVFYSCILNYFNFPKTLDSERHQSLKLDTRIVEGVVLSKLNLLKSACIQFLLSPPPKVLAYVFKPTEAPA